MGGVDASTVEVGMAESGGGAVFSEQPGSSKEVWRYSPDEEEGTSCELTVQYESRQQHFKWSPMEQICKSRHALYDVYRLCSGLPGCCCGWGQGGRRGTGPGRRDGW